MLKNALCFLLGLSTILIVNPALTATKQLEITGRHYMLLATIKETNPKLMHIIVDFNVTLVNRCQQFFPIENIDQHPSYAELVRAEKLHGRDSQDYRLAIDNIVCQ